MGIVQVKLRVAGNGVYLQLMLHSTKTLVIDCEPFGPRPDEFLSAALERTSLICKPPQSTLFGAWTFDFSEDVNSTQWNNMLPDIIANLHDLHNSGAIRYAAWTPHIT